MSYEFVLVRFSEDEIMLEKTVAALFIGAMSLLVALPVKAEVPEYGTVIEGQSVPGVSLGDTRAHVEAAYGTPTRCQSGANPGDAASCTWILEDYIGQGGQVQSQVRTGFRGPNGGNASNDPNDVVTGISWHGLDGWVTTTGINTLYALNNQDAVIALYPNGIVFHQSLFDTHLTAYENGISLSWHTAYLSGFTNVRMSIFEPRDPPPPREPSVNVSEINMDLYKRQVIGEVRVLNDLNWRVRGAEVYATWTLRDGTTQAVQGTTDSFGLVVFVVNKARKGTYTLTIDDVVVEDHPFDSDNSVLSASIVKKR
jgi:hypothetical protein